MPSAPLIPPESLARVADALAALARAGLPALEARMLVSHVTGLSRVQLITQDACAVEDAARRRISELATRRLAGEPMAYLLGEREFFGRVFRVSPAVLIPRPDTEVLVEQALDRLEERDAPSVLDMGTGSGIIAVTIALARPDARVWATDASAEALAVARDNAQALGAPNVQTALGDWYGALAATDAPPAFDLIVSNPPYIAAADAHLGQGDLRFEPAGALTDDGDGLRHLRTIVAGAPARLAAGAWLLLEHGYDQGAVVRALLAGAGFADVFTVQDLGGQDRCSGGQWRAENRA
ncbi:peptide chain release factor N(5)-glutamine methyltransferase [Ralstonia mannitolilytica]|uniref:peptide chain release factor N(5)-glutamine methyltransferase n=1 Tax=Ralstonia mannitolilytica TaxID=105219 RepID=UPI0005D74EE4|nr:peptide chain release factor N(5)-glutamine methyltransferase [Ralstonia mannitolilytica]AJW43276.1 SAM-dependent methyltransferase [Ralstonia mannitolilytica]QIF08546.1 peptide chain release factor N(5)-glutamine methyltransferase [Ralstonia mannitolilytica]CAJ0732619.1 Release factor glutamine methyltransferase [Ralstonia mannitolilytica]CAJ0796486.1 Release factor glutamine methyltransferase [Ralstonia mannitolilytica]